MTRTHVAFINLECLGQTADHFNAARIIDTSKVPSYARLRATQSLKNKNPLGDKTGDEL